MHQLEQLSCNQGHSHSHSQGHSRSRSHSHSYSHSCSHGCSHRCSLGGRRGCRTSQFMPWPSMYSLQSEPYARSGISTPRSGYSSCAGAGAEGCRQPCAASAGHTGTTVDGRW